MRVYNYTEKDLKNGVIIYIPYSDKRKETHYKFEWRGADHAYPFWLIHKEGDSVCRNSSIIPTVEELLFKLNNELVQMIRLYKIW